MTRKVTVTLMTKESDSNVNDKEVTFMTKESDSDNNDKGKWQ